jgi:hypothetical protein
MRRLLLIKSPTGLLKKQHIDGASDACCFEDFDDKCQHFIDGKKGESCELFGDWFDGSEDNARLPECLEAERLGKEKAGG